MLVDDSLPLLLKLESFHVFMYLKGHFKYVFKFTPVVIMKHGIGWILDRNSFSRMSFELRILG